MEGRLGNPVQHSWSGAVGAPEATIGTFGKVIAGLYLLGAVMLVLLFSFNHRTPGTVVDMHTFNGSCGRRSYGTCTHFEATVRYEALGKTRTCPSKQMVRGADQPLARSRLRVGDAVTVFYTEARPDYGYVVSGGFLLMMACMVLIPFPMLAGWIGLSHLLAELRRDHDDEVPEPTP